MFSEQSSKRVVLAASLLFLTGIALLLVALFAPDTTRETRVLCSRLSLGLASAALAVVAFAHRTRLLAFLERFFLAAETPLNLALARILVFTLLYRRIDVDRVAFFAELPAELRIFPFGTQWALSLVPIDGGFATSCAIALQVCCIAAMIGLLTRPATVLAVVLGLYVYVLPYLFGNVGHTGHHLIWFAAVLAASPCGAALSVDRLVRVQRAALRDAVEPTRRDPAYGLPLRLIWLLLGVLYFFPGFWKFWVNGVDWILSDNLMLLMHEKWHANGGWLPVFRIDEYPGLLRFLAFGSIAFEMSFVFLMLGRWPRALAAVVGLSFHRMISYFMRIGFASLPMCYLMLFDWDALLRWIGRSLVAERTVVYDGARARSRCLAALGRELDLVGRVRFVDRRGSSASRALASSRSLRPLIAVGCVLLAGNTAFGFMQRVKAWPFACYPTFSWMAPATRSSLVMVVEDERGEATRVPDRVVRSVLNEAKLSAMITALVRTEDETERMRKLRGWWELVLQASPELDGSRAVRFERVTESTHPDHWDDPPLSRASLGELRFEAATAAP